MKIIKKINSVFLVLLVLLFFNSNIIYATSVDNDDYPIEVYKSIFASMDVAKSIVIADSGLLEDDITIIKSKYTNYGFDIGFDIQFIYKDKRYEYFITQNSMQILKRDIYKILNLQTDYNKYVTSNTISLNIAKQIAVSKSALKLKQVLFTKIEYEYDQNRLIYNIEYFYNNVRYEAKVNAYNGLLIDWTRNLIYE